jgi:glycerophosphoryl diester phosphodiesterase
VYELRSEDVLALDAGRWFAPRFAGERITTMAEFLDWMTPHERLGVMLEAKPYGTGADLARAVLRSNISDRTCIVSFLPEELRAVKQVAPELPCYLLFDARPGLDIVDLTLAFGLDGADVQLRWMNEDFVRRMHAAGLAVIASTADDPASIEELVRIGADFVDTNDPRVAVATRDARS